MSSKQRAKIIRTPAPSSRWLIELIYTLAAHRVSVRYKETVFGFGWILLQPVALTFIFYYIFHRFAKISSGDVPYPLFVATGQIVWSFTTLAINQSLICVSSSAPTLRRIYFPRVLLPFSVILAAFADLAILTLLVGGLFVYYQYPLTMAALWVVPVFLIHVALLLGLACFGALAIVILRDLGHAIPSFMQIWFFASPVFYPFSMVPDEFKTLSKLNPMTGIIESYRATLLSGQPPAWDLLMPAAIFSVLLLTGGIYAMNRLESVVVDIL